MAQACGRGEGAQTTSACMKWGLRGAHFTTDIGMGSAHMHITGVPCISLLQGYKGIIMVTLNPAQWYSGVQLCQSVFTWDLAIYLSYMTDCHSVCSLLVSCQCSDSVNRQCMALKCIIV